LRGRRRAKLRPWSARTTQRRCNECRAAPWKVSFPRWWVQVPSHRRPRRLADGMEGQLATHTADWNAFFVSLQHVGVRQSPSRRGRGGLPDCFLQLRRRYLARRPRWPGPCQGQGNKQHRVPALPKRHGWDGWHGWEVVPFLGDVCWCIRRPPVMRAAMVTGGVWLAPRRLRKHSDSDGQKWPANFPDFFFFWRRPFAVYFGKAGGEHKRRADGSIWK
jgi:hypothetical protein